MIISLLKMSQLLHEFLMKTYIFLNPNEVLQIANTLHLSTDEDAIIWKFESKCIYIVISMYVVVNFRGIMPTHVYAAWKIKVHSKNHVFH
jgi:hypothetical protein